MIRKTIFILLLSVTSNALSQDNFQREIDYFPSADKDYKEDLTMREHTISFNPFLAPLLSANLRYNYFFGYHMQWAINVRTTYISPVTTIFEDKSTMILGTGIKYIPFYFKFLSLGVDITPTYLFEVFTSESRWSTIFPLSLNVDFLLSDRVGLAMDFGAGYAIGPLLGERFLPRGHIGILFMFGQKKSVWPEYDSRY
ncbi:MAG: hypothetical protein HUJ25_10975 [Crocinitomicaceae bacterium]|nr:hypothetical protein [Crocinitomicaceae bacterium]